MARRAFIIVLDGFGIGSMPDSAKFGDERANTLSSICDSEYFHIPNLMRMGMGNIDGVECLHAVNNGDGCMQGLPKCRPVKIRQRAIGRLLVW